MTTNIFSKMFLFLAVLGAFHANAGGFADRSYSVSESGSDEHIEIYNDGRNTYIQAVPGLIIKGATADGDKLIVSGIPSEIRGWKNGKPITLARIDSTVSKAPAIKPADSVALNTRLEQITKELALLVKKEAPVVTAPVITEISWDIKSDDLAINPTIRRWAKIAGWQVSWEIPVDYPVTLTDKFVGTFESAVARVVTAYEGSDYPPKVCFYDNKVVRVVRLIGNGKECDSK
jgi:hypothetical protein